jgi:hypothetical protein
MLMQWMALIDSAEENEKLESLPNIEYNLRQGLLVSNVERSITIRIPNTLPIKKIAIIGEGKSYSHKLCH